LHCSKQHWKVSLRVSREEANDVITHFPIHRVAHSARVNVYGIPFIREMPRITGVSGSDLVIKCPVAGYPIDKIHWERGSWELAWAEKVN